MADTLNRKSFLQAGAAIVAGLALPAAAGPMVPDAKAARAAARPRVAGRSLIRNVDVLTMQPDHGELQGVDVLLADGVIAAIAKTLPADNAEIVEGAGRILMPGLVDGVRSNWMSLETGRLLYLNQGFDAFFAYTKKMAAAMTPDDRYLADYLGGVQALDSGFTAMINFGRGGSVDQVDQACAGFKASGIGGVYCHAIEEAAGTTLPGDADFAFARMLRDRHFGSGATQRFGLALPLNWGATNAAFAAFYQRSRALEPQVMAMFHHNYGGGTGNMHTLEALPPGTIGSVADLRDQGLLGPDLHFVHATELTDAELRFLAAAGVTFCSAVLSEFRYPEQVTSIVARAQAAGAPACLGSDVPLAQSYDPFAMVRAAFALLYRTTDNRAIVKTLGSDDTLGWLTRDAARCARLGDTGGTIAAGRRADVILLNTDRIGMPGIGTLADRVASFAVLGDVDSVWVGGVARKRHGRMVGIDIAALKAKAAAHQQRLWQALGAPTFGIRA